MKKKPYSARIVMFDRRQILKLGGAAVASATLLPGCDTLLLPELELRDRITDIVPNEDFYLQSAFGTPAVDPATHVLRILAEGSELASFDQSHVNSLAARDREHTLQCIGANPRFLFIGNAVWGGLPFREILAGLGVTVPATALWMKITGADDYATGLPITDLDGTDGADPLWLVWTMNGEPLPLDHGAPFRFLTPGRYGTKNPKWPSEVDFVEAEFIGHWEANGWSQLASYQTNGLVLSPPTMAVLGTGMVAIVGTAFSGHTPIESVEVTTDGGTTWQSAELTYSPSQSETPGDVTDVNTGRHIWTTWRFEWQLDEPGDYTIQVRVTDADGGVSDLDPAGTDRLNGYNAGMEISVEVT